MKREIVNVEFSLDFNKEIEEIIINIINIYVERVFNNERIEKLIKKMVDENLIRFGEGRTKGELILYEDGWVDVDYSYCDGPGEDWNDDEWEYKYVKKVMKW